MRVLGIDPGLTRTGYGVVDTIQAGYSHVTHGVIRPSKRDPLPERLAAIYNELTEVISSYEPDEMSVESLFFSRNAKTAFKLGHARGVAIMTAVHANMKLAEYAPTKIKSAVVGRGGARKEQVAHMVKALLGPLPDDIEFDATDALAAAICHIHHSSQRELIRRS